MVFVDNVNGIKSMIKVLVSVDYPAMLRGSTIWLNKDVLACLNTFN